MNTQQSHPAAQTWRRTRWMRTSVYRAFRYALAVAASFAIVVFLFWRFAQPPIVIPPVPPLPSHNAYAGVMRAASRIKSHTSDAKVAAAQFEFSKNPHTIAEMERALRSRQATFTALRGALRIPYMQPSDRDLNKEASGRVVNFVELRTMARMLGTDSHVRAARGDSAGAVRSALDVMQLGVELPHGAVLVGLMVGTMFEDIGQTALRPLIATLPSTLLETTLRRLQQIRARRVLFGDIVVEDKWLLLQLLKTAPNGYEAIEPWSDSPVAILSFRASAVVTGRQAIARDFSEYAEKTERIARMPYQTAVAARAVPLRTRYWVTESLADADYARAHRQFETRRATTDLLLLSVALRLYRARTGAYPLALNELLLAKVLSEIPADPFSVAAREPFRYRRLTADKYLLYSVGQDGIDDSGRPPATPAATLGDLIAP